MINQKKNICHNVIMVVCSVLIGVFSVLSFGAGEPSARDVYTKTFNSVVELKAYDNEEDAAFGSAVCIDERGYFITNAHIVRHEEFGTNKFFTEIMIRFPDSDDFENASIVSVDEENDLAIIKYNGTHKLNVLKINMDYKTGDKCFAVGNAQNYGISIAEGIISKSKVNIKYNNDVVEAVQCDINITDGNSGGALLDARGKLIGVTTFRTKDNFNNVVYGIGFSLPAETIKHFIEKTIK